MKSILDDLYYGSTTPGDQKIIRGSEYDKTAKELLDIEDQLRQVNPSHPSRRKLSSIAAN